MARSRKRGAGKNEREPQNSQPAKMASGDAQFWSRFRRSVEQTESHTQSLVLLAREATRPGVRPWLEFVGFLIAIAALVVAIYANYQNAEAIRQNSESLEGLKDSLQRAQVSSVFVFGAGPCKDPATGEVTALAAYTVLTNTGRLPITVVHVGVDPFYVNEFNFQRLDDPSDYGAGPFVLGVGEAVAVSYGVRGLGLPENVIVRLSDGSQVATISAGGEGKWIVDVPLWAPEVPSVCPAPTVPGDGIPLKDAFDENGNLLFPFEVLPPIVLEIDGFGGIR